MQKNIVTLGEPFLSNLLTRSDQRVLPNYCQARMKESREFDTDGCTWRAKGSELEKDVIAHEDDQAEDGYKTSLTGRDLSINCPNVVV